MSAMNNTEAPLSLGGTAAFTACHRGSSNAGSLILEPVLILRLCFGAHVLPCLIAGEVSPNEKEAL